MSYNPTNNVLGISCDRDIRKFMIVNNVLNNPKPAVSLTSEKETAKYINQNSKKKNITGILLDDTNESGLSEEQKNYFKRRLENSKRFVLEASSPLLTPISDYLTDTYSLADSLI
jgi:hypothetical protein